MTVQEWRRERGRHRSQSLVIIYHRLLGHFIACIDFNTDSTFLGWKQP